eukprot:TRINITY_DN1240_c0_g1_i11.p1 TRINITY_DN1240_c0_g1~~TRINITY_DN1240_c0_g1_i11.p1  ORF type:complete len:421 (-),score=82.76 TRINITY_DN1240_c0_g1_i11:400-1662(-)
MTISLKFFVSLLLFGSVVSVLPEENFVERVFKGEGVNCDGTFAQVAVSSEQVVRTEEEVVSAVAEAVASAADIVDSPESAVAAAESASEAIVEVVAQATASVAAAINSPAPTCWAIAFGKAEAVAIANATVTAISQGVAQAIGGDDELLAEVETVAQSVSNNVTTSVEQIALLLLDGSGQGKQSERKDVTAIAKATSINCALARVFARIVDGEAETIVLTTAGCLEPPTALPAEVVAVDGCECLEEAWGPLPAGCGQWGDRENGDYICYVKDPDMCDCDWGTDRFPGVNAAWRYCGPTLRTMQTYMNFDDVDNEILSTPSGFAFCSSSVWNPNRDDAFMAPEPSPSPSPLPAPVPAPPQIPLVRNCPRLRCIGSAGTCCEQGSSYSTCNTRIRSYKYLGQCVNSFEDVWLPDVGSACRCA